MAQSLQILKTCIDSDIVTELACHKYWPTTSIFKLGIRMRMMPCAAIVV